MKRKANRLFCLFLTLVLLCGTLAVPAAAATQQSQAAANELYGLGLFQGVGTLPDGSPDFALDGIANRAQAVVMLVRLLGGEAEARSLHYSHPFTDVSFEMSWANDYLGYAYQKSIINGTSDITFSPEGRVSVENFLTMLLRAMGYSQVDWQDPFPTARAVGLDWSGESDFRRGDMAYICLDALSCRPSGSSQTLFQILEDQGAIQRPVEPEEPVQPVEPTQPGIVPGPVAGTAAGTYNVVSGSDALEKLINAINCRVENIVLRGPVSLMDACEEAVQQAWQCCSDIGGYHLRVSYDSRTMTMTVTPAYSDAVEIMAYLEGKRSSLSDINARTLERARQVHNALVTPEMSEYDRVKAFHDWLVNNTTYQDGASAHDAAGPLLYGRSVCDGYAKAFDLLCYLSGIECTRVVGKANGGDHAWNKVKVNGSWYNIDVTWDDPVSSRPMLTYDYFLISDSAIARDHTANDNPYCPAAPANWPGR